MTPLENTPELWKTHIPFPKTHFNKYSRGHAVIMGGESECTGAARMAAIAALRAGAGLVTVACPQEALPIYASSLLAVMVSPYANEDDIEKLYNDKRKNAFLIGPGNGINEATKNHIYHALYSRKKCVIDADAISVFQPNPFELFDTIQNYQSNTILTPHDGEFSRIFELNDDRMACVENAARKSHAVIVLKGSTTLIAHPDGRVVANYNAPSTLATAGSGDVLAGIITGLLASGVDIFYAACMGVWMHAEAANQFGIGLIAEDLPNQLPKVWQELKEKYGTQ